MWAQTIADLGCLDLVLDEVIVESYVSRFVIMTSGHNMYTAVGDSNRFEGGSR
jgi:hypothetical protein